MIIIRNITPVKKSNYIMNKIVLADSKEELTAWRNRNRRKYKQIFYGSPRKDKPYGYYALASK